MLTLLNMDAQNNFRNRVYPGLYCFAYFFGINLCVCEADKSIIVRYCENKYAANTVGKCADAFQPAFGLVVRYCENKYAANTVGKCADAFQPAFGLAFLKPLLFVVLGYFSDKIIYSHAVSSPFTTPVPNL